MLVGGIVPRGAEWAENTIEPRSLCRPCGPLSIFVVVLVSRVAAMPIDPSDPMEPAEMLPGPAQRTIRGSHPSFESEISVS